jgi:hypothetical protein
MHTPTEIDSLLPTKSSLRQDQQGSRKPSRLNWLIICCGGVIVVVALNGCRIDYSAKSQLTQLNTMTHTSLDSILDISLLARLLISQPKQEQEKNRHGKMSVITGKDVNPQVYHCISSLMIMRHCDKGVKVKKHGFSRIIDPKDKHGDLHCNAKGV